MSETTYAPAPPSAEALAAWAAAEAEAEAELAAQDAAREAAEAAQRASGLPPPSAAPVVYVERPVGPARGRRFLPFVIVFACGGWGAAGSLLLVNARRAPVAHPNEVHATEGDEKKKTNADGKNAPPAARVDALIREGKFADALQQCRDGSPAAVGVKESRLALRAGLCFEGQGRWGEAADAYRKAETDSHVLVWSHGLLGQARCAIREDDYTVARVLVNRALLRSGHPECRGSKVCEEALFLRARLAVLEAGSASVLDPLDAEPATWPFPRGVGAYLDGLPTDAPTSGSPTPAAALRDLVEIHRTLDAPGALQVTARLTARPTIAVLRSLATTAGWKVQASDRIVARLALPAGPLDVDHLPLPELLCALTESAAVAWEIQGDTLLLTHAVPPTQKR